MSATAKDQMTFGEMVVYSREMCKIVNGEFVFAKTLPRRMSKKEACAYYTEKLSKVWKNKPEASK